MSASKEWVPSLCSKSRSSYVVAATVMLTRLSMPLGAEMKHAMLPFRRNVCKLPRLRSVSPTGKRPHSFYFFFKADIFFTRASFATIPGVYSLLAKPPPPFQSQHLGQNQPTVSPRRHLPKSSQSARYCITPPESTKQVGKKLQGANSEA